MVNHIADSITDMLGGPLYLLAAGVGVGAMIYLANKAGGGGGPVFLRGTPEQQALQEKKYKTVFKKD